MAEEEKDIQKEEIETDKSEDLELDETFDGEAAISDLITGNEESDVKEPIKGETETDKLKEPVITDELIEQFPTLAGLKGKKVEDVFKSYDSLSREYTKLNQEVKGKETKDKEPEVIEAKEFLELTPKEQSDYIKGLAKEVAEQMMTEKEKDLEPMKEVVRERQEKALMDSISDGLPEGVEPKDALEAWKEANKDIIFKDGQPNTEFIDTYDKHPQKLINEVISLAKLQFYEDQLSDNKKNLKKKTYDQAKKALKDAKKPELVSKDARRSAEELTDVDNLLVEINESIPQE